MIHKVVFERAGEVSGKDAYLYEEDGTPYLGHPWDQASSALLHTAMSHGAPSFLTANEHLIMTAPLRRIAPTLMAKIEAKQRTNFE